MELGIYSFAERLSDPHTGATLSPQQRITEVLEEIELADQVGLDVYGLGEHHRKDFVASSPALVLSAAAARTKNIRLSSAVTVISSSDPVRVFEDFATLDLVSGGRAEIMVGRGSFVESFPLYGFDLSDYDELFDEKLELLQLLNANEHVTWSGAHRPALRDQPVHPRPLQPELPIWVGVGGTPASALRAGRLGLPSLSASSAGTSVASRRSWSCTATSTSGQDTTGQRCASASTRTGSSPHV
ncbi:LLM class flavin-dependent oxidoreductase [Microbacterium sp. NIBRBAC000506063]|uniref:LLM class flavin-dependent oxidoreductase n=1 Tax=Microbacterium sp. NIBRBAC000506063 TaxID=2734618 RepID=UPI001CB7491C|nr:LLM class flavin-dependent oxidoreductase [Microbacterium sp. NIBRBAC000506063]